MRTRGGETLRLSEQQRTFDVGALIIPSPPPLYPRRCALALVVVSLRATRPPPCRGADCRGADVGAGTLPAVPPLRRVPGRFHRTTVVRVLPAPPSVGLPAVDAAAIGGSSCLLTLRLSLAAHPSS